MYAQPDHRFCRRWAVMTDPEETLGASGAGIKVGGFLILLHFTMINCDTLDKLRSDEPLGLYVDFTCLLMINVNSVSLSVSEKVHRQVLTTFVTISFIRAT